MERSPSRPWQTKTGDFKEIHTENVFFTIVSPGFMDELIVSVAVFASGWCLLPPFISLLFTALMVLTGLVRNSPLPGTKSASSDLHTVPDPSSSLQLSSAQPVLLLLLFSLSG